MKSVIEKLNASSAPESRDEFHLGMTIIVVVLFLLFFAASFYIMISSYGEMS